MCFCTTWFLHRLRGSVQSHTHTHTHMSWLHLIFPMFMYCVKTLTPIGRHSIHGHGR